MKSFRTLFVAVLAAAALLTAAGVADAQAKRLGGGRSVGKQSQQVQNRDTVPRETPAAGKAGVANSGTPHAAPRTQSPAASAAIPGASSAPASSASGANRRLGPIAGLAAGLGLGALGSHLGIGEELASALTLLLALFLIVALARWIISRRAAAEPARRIITPSFAYAGIGHEASVPVFRRDEDHGRNARFEPIIVRPSAPVLAAGASRSSSRIPPDFDSDGFLRQAREQYVRLQGAYDAADFTTIRNFATADMYALLKAEIDERSDPAQRAADPTAGRTEHRTDVVTLHSELLGIDSGPNDHVASVRFYGVLRDGERHPAQSFDEVWNLVKPVDGSAGWVLAGIQQLQ